jgi:electron transfer flavoprotein alpha subunit
MATILVVAEHWQGVPEGITLQMLTKGREVADGAGAELAVLVLGHNVGSVAEALKGKGADRILVLDDAKLDKAAGHTQAAAIAAAVKAINPRLVLIGYTLVGMELAPAVAAKLGTTALTNCVDVALTDKGLTVTRPFFEGTVHAKLAVEGTGPALVAIQKGATPTLALPAKDAKVESVAADLSAIQPRGVIESYYEEPAGEIDLGKADVIVSVGRGIGAPDKIDIVNQLAQALGGLMGCSRPLVDQGWLPKERQVGASGRTVTPKVYVACGISGASQHLAGMSESKMIVAINKDPNAPIFGVAHVGVVGDLFEIVPALTEAAKQRRN